ncbi:kinase-like domain-containing protein [Rhizophagus irregularis DAOM 181602=DAOM 197198]|uniref:Kinase-like domain-containing protein n=1 Tax=Rhizophagus irregularis (strain DAOM 181602 / DAOM 197198 / MUCL 43194) TaxID=747089 RepID=A0A2P4QZE7_RHIID|nr:kinase-like domain-containing protein [Rhizophagus irregularis DAOM 181602=DAOM 197198]POG83030.1 kinase-like domain-containing protein [Rhizophagus irregularis DAOM 181602=DAOM 197198]|eukprot:XP_025189896.1 kinase-like domain-containing protein [Rhizophagus irregularis DAOM 181602=DAOM 197198]
MSYSQNLSVNAAINKAFALIDYNIYNDIHKQFEFFQRILLANDLLTENEKYEAITIITRVYDSFKIALNDGIKRTCESCEQECLATLYCECCVRKYLKSNFLNWAPGNKNINNLIQECQMKTLKPNRIIEWIPYNNLENIKYLTKGGCSEIYTAVWIYGHFTGWNSKEQQLKRFGRQEVILKRLENVENANRNWVGEAKSHLTISNKWAGVVQCYGLTQEPSNGNYMLVMNEMNTDLRKYLHQNHNKLTWKERIQIITDISDALAKIHEENAIHRDLHSGNILYNFGNAFRISDLGFCGPADIPLKSIYGNLPYIAPEVIIRKEQTFKSDIYSIAMLMWEISSGQPPFINYEHNYDLAMYIVNGIRPKIVSGTPLEYKNLMRQCWNADPSKRPDIGTFLNEIDKLNLFYHSESDDRPEENNNLKINSNVNSLESYESYTNSTSKVFQFENLPEPKNATEEELEAFYSKSIDFNIPDNIDDFDKLNDQKNKKNTPKLCSIFKVGCKKLFKILKRNPKDGIQNDKKGKIICVTACVKTTRKKSKKSKEK